MNVTLNTVMVSKGPLFLFTLLIVGRSLISEKNITEYCANMVVVCAFSNCIVEYNAFINS